MIFSTSYIFSDVAVGKWQLGATKVFLQKCFFFLFVEARAGSWITFSTTVAYSATISVCIINHRHRHIYILVFPSPPPFQIKVNSKKCVEDPIFGGGERIEICLGGKAGGYDFEA